LDASRARIVEDLSQANEVDASDAAFGGPATRARLFVERADLRTMLTHQTAWADLAGRALESNIFLDPGFALPLVQHMASGRRPTFVLVWEEDSDTAFGRLVGLMALAPPAFPADPVVRAFSHSLICLGTPLVDRTRGSEAWTLLLEWLGTDPRQAALALTGLPRDGAFFRMLVDAELGSRCHILSEAKRACLGGRDAHAPVAKAAMSAKRRKEMRRLSRRLADLGHRSFVSARTPAEIGRATERFLALEHRGWKGGRGSALLADRALATFTRSMTRLMAHEGKCRIDSLEVDGRAVAMGIVLTAGGRAHFWKTAFDEAYAPLSPGVQLALEITEAQLADPTIRMTDSCAAPDHPMIDRLWPDRMMVADILINLRPGAPRRFATIYRIELWHRAMRRTAKTIWKHTRRVAR